MKTKILLFALLASSLLANAQTESYQNYLNKALLCVDNGDCEKAKEWYDAYKELSGKTSSSAEALIQDCTHSTTKVVINDKKYVINNKINIEGCLYRVAYVEDDGLHGFAIYNIGAGNAPGDLRKKFPTRAEMSIIASNADKLKLQKDLYYWTVDQKNSSGYYYLYKLADGSTRVSYYQKMHGRILIYRF